MREIKIRFIFKDGNFFATKYATLEELCDSCFIMEDMEEKIYCDLNISGEEDFCEFEIFKSQYTGLKDKNKEEIYECDVVRLYTKSDFSEPEDWNIYEGEVKMKEGQWIIFDNNTNQPLYGFKDIIKMGNIYENSELLEKDKK